VTFSCKPSHTSYATVIYILSYQRLTSGRGADHVTLSHCHGFSAEYLKLRRVLYRQHVIDTLSLKPDATVRPSYGEPLPLHKSRRVLEPLQDLPVLVHCHITLFCIGPMHIDELQDFPF